MEHCTQDERKVGWTHNKRPKRIKETIEGGGGGNQDLGKMKELDKLQGRNN